jgi:hypothetical protein
MADKFLKLVNGVLLEAEADHSSLAGLGDDDHTQYHNDTRGDARYPIGDGVRKITAGTTQPINPSVGDLWIDTN